MMRGVLLALCTAACASTPPPESPEPPTPAKAITVAPPATSESAPSAEPPARTAPRDPLAPSLEPPIFPSISFANGNITIPDEAKALLDEIAAELKERPSILVDVNGHMETGEPAGLGAGRAKIVANYLVSHGVGRNRVRIVDRSDTEPASTRDPAQNRRVSFRPYEAEKK